MGRLTHIITHYKLYHTLGHFASPIAEHFDKYRIRKKQAEALSRKAVFCLLLNFIFPIRKGG